MPPAFADAYSGPHFGIAGTRRLAGVQGRPLIGTIIKPSVGLEPDATAALIKQLCEAGIDFVKDDELQSDGPHCPFDERVRAVMRVIEAEADRTGKKPMFAFNLTDDLDQMRRRHDTLIAHGASCLMASLNSVGLVGMVELRRFSELPIHAHRNGWGYPSRHPLLGWSYVAWQKLWRLAGAAGRDPLVYSAAGPGDSAVAALRQAVATAGLPPETVKTASAQVSGACSTGWCGGPSSAGS
jgi:ribulose-bisphosphate carboxylase large chain